MGELSGELLVLLRFILVVMLGGVVTDVRARLCEDRSADRLRALSTC